MAEAKISSTEVIRVFRTAMIKFAENAGAALGNADSDVNRALMWLDLEAKPFWTSEIRKRQAALAEAQERLRMKVLYKNFDGTTPSAVDEKKAVLVAKQRLEMAEQKANNVRKYLAIMQKETVLYKGAMQRFSTTVQSVPVAIAQLSRVMLAIERYLAASAEVANVSGTQADESRPGYMDILQSMSRPVEEEAALNESAAEVTENAEPAPAAAPEQQPVESKEPS